MITLVDIKKSINEVLEDNFKDVNLYANEVLEGFKRPSFFTSVIPIGSNYDTVNFNSNKLMVIINYFSKNKTELENLKMADELKREFGMTLKVKGRHLTLHDIRTEITDGVLQFKFDLNYYDGIDKIEDHEKAKEIEISMKE